MDAKKVVREGYDKVSEAYRSEDFDYANSGYKTFLSWLEPKLPPQAHVLDLGCGIGIPVARVLSQNFKVHGVDISAVQIERARQLVPEAEFQCADITELDFHPDSFDAVVAFFSIIHIPVEEQPALFDSLTSWLVSGGYLLATVGSEAWTGTEPDWRGVEGATMYWSYTNPDTYRSWLAERGFEIIEEGFLPKGDGGHTILLAQLKKE
jgi:SAM-dependent methyltransferase